MDFHSRRKKSILVAITIPSFNCSRFSTNHFRCHEEDERMLALKRRGYAAHISDRKKETWVVGEWHEPKEEEYKVSMLYLGWRRPRNVEFKLYRYLSSDNDRMAIAGVAALGAAAARTLGSMYSGPVRSIIHSFECASQRTTSCNRVYTRFNERKLNRL